MRKIVLGLVGAALVAALVAVLVIVTRSDDQAPPDDPAARSVVPEARAPVYRRDGVRLIRPKDIVPAVEGEDYEVLRQIPGPIGYKAEAFLPDGDLVLVHTSRLSGANLLPDLVQIWDPESDERETLPVRWPRGIQGVAATSANDVWVSFNQDGGAERLPRLMHYERRTGATTVFAPPQVAEARSDHHLGTLQAGGDGRIYFMTGSEPCYRGRCPSASDRELWSFDPGAPEVVRKEGEGSINFSVSDKLLAWVAGGPDRATLRVRALGSSRVHEAHAPGCPAASVFYPAVLVSDDTVLLGCGRLYDSHAEQLADLDFQTHELRGISNGWVAFGRTVYRPDAATEPVLRIASERIWHQRLVVMHDDLILFPTGTTPPNTRGGSWTLARLLPR